MNTFESVLGDAAGGALCNLLSVYGSAADLLLAISLLEPTPVGEALAVGAGLAGLAAATGCSWDTGGQPPESNQVIQGCESITGGTGRLELRALSAPSDPGLELATGVQSVSTYLTQDTFYVIRCWVAHYPDGTSSEHCFIQYAIGDPPREVNFSLLTPDSGTCNPPPYVPPQPPTYTHTDPSSGCELNVDFKGWGVNTSGNINGIWEISPALPPGRASGGIIGGCNFAPVIYVDGGGGSGGDGGGRYFTIPDPVPPDGDEPWWAPIARGLIQGAGAAATQSLIKSLFDKVYTGGSYELNGVCELDPDGNPMPVKRSVTIADATSPDAILYRLDALADMFQFAKELRQPTCKQQVIPVTGEAVSINWVSDEYSPNGNDRIRKLLTYFDQAGSTLEQTVAHWKDFTWNAGPVIVSCVGTPLGKPQVWADSLDEAKRVIGHAAAIAGVDLTNAEWMVAPPKSSRYGMSGLMRVHRSDKGILGITKRDGPSGLPTGIA